MSCKGQEPMDDKLESTSRPSQLTLLAQTWLRRLHPQLNSRFDAFIVVGGPSDCLGQRIALNPTASQIPIGRGRKQAERDSTARIQLPSSSVSVEHGLLHYTREGWQICSAGCHQRIYIGTVRATEHRLVYGDEVRIGNFVLLFVPAAIEEVPLGVIDLDTGLLQPRVFLAEISQIAERRPEPDSPDLGLALILVEGLRRSTHYSGSIELEATSGLGDGGGGHQNSLRMIGRALLQSLAVAWPEILAEDLLVQARSLSQTLTEIGISLQLGLPTIVTVPRRGAPATGPEVLAAGVSGLDAMLADQRGTIVEASLDCSGFLLKGESLLDTLRNSRGADLLVVTLQDEDYLRHQVGNQRLAGLRWSLIKTIFSVVSKQAKVGVLDERVFVLLTEAPAAVNEQLRERFIKIAKCPLRCVTLPVPKKAGNMGDLEHVIVSAVDNPTSGSAVVGTKLDVRHLPAPIAGPYSMIWVVSSETARVKTILDAVEAMTRFLTLCVLAVVSKTEVNHPRIHQALPPNSRMTGWTLGRWLGLLRDLAPCLQTESDGGGPIEEVLTSVIGKTRKGTAYTDLVFKELLPDRNDFTHSHLATSERRAECIASDLLESLNILIRRATPLRALELIYVLDISKSKKARNQVDCRILTGAREVFEVRRVDIIGQAATSVLWEESCYLATEDYRTLLEVSPLLSFVLCPQCEREEIFITNGLPSAGKKMQMQAVTTGHKAKRPMDLEELPEGLGVVLE